MTVTLKDTITTSSLSSKTLLSSGYCFTEQAGQCEDAMKTLMYISLLTTMR